MLAQGETEETRQQIVSSVVTINSIFDGRPTPLGDGLFGRVANELFSVLSQTEDDNILQEGLESLTFVVRKDVDQLINWSVAQSVLSMLTVTRLTGLRCSIQVKPNRSEWANDPL